MASITRTDADLVKRIIKCESNFKPGAKHLNTNGTTDHSIFQINDKVHKEEMAKQGLDIENLWDNLAYGFYLLETQGTRPWAASQPCWDKFQNLDSYARADTKT